MSFFGFRSILRAIVLVSFLPVAATAQSNEVFLLQDSVQLGVGNTLFIDQSDAAASRAGSLEMPLQQIGGGNTAEIFLEGFGAEVTSFLQSSGDAGFAQNTATITGATEARVALEQLGFGNEATIFAGGIGNSAELRQEGDENLGSITLTGMGQSGRLEQIGDNNQYALSLTGMSLLPGETSVVVTQLGNNLSQVGLGAAGLEVVTNAAGTVFITQTAP